MASLLKSRSSSPTNITQFLHRSSEIFSFLPRRLSTPKLRCFFGLIGHIQEVDQWEIFSAPPYTYIMKLQYRLNNDTRLKYLLLNIFIHSNISSETVMGDSVESWLDTLIIVLNKSLLYQISWTGSTDSEIIWQNSLFPSFKTFQ